MYFEDAHANESWSRMNSGTINKAVQGSLLDRVEREKTSSRTRKVKVIAPAMTSGPTASRVPMAKSYLIRT